MAFVKLDTGVLDSTLWTDRPCREIFITALLMAEPTEIDTSMPQFEVRALEPTGFVVQPGWYGFVRAAGIGIVNRALLDSETGMMALDRLGKPDNESRSKEFEGRRLVRVDGGFIVLNYFKYRDRDHTAAERQRRMRERKRNAVTIRNEAVTSRIADADADAEKNKKKKGADAPPFDPLSIPGLNLEAWKLWVEHRTAIKKPIRPHSMADAAEALAKLGARQIDEVKRARAGGWQGLHPEEPKVARFATAQPSAAREFPR